jgi:hypothetical protein
MTDLDDGPVPAALGEPILDLLGGFIGELRQAGIPVSLTENLDAMRAIEHIPLEDRETFKYALAATMVKNNSHWRAFETVFEVYFSLRGKEYGLGGDEAADLDALADELQEMQGQDGDQGAQGGGGGEPLTPEQLAELLYKALLQGNQPVLRAVARQAVRRYAGMEPGRPVGGTTTCTARSGTSTSTACSRSSCSRRGRTPTASSRRSRSGWSATSSTPASRS